VLQAGSCWHQNNPLGVERGEWKKNHLLSFWFPPVPWRAWRTSRLKSLFEWGKCGFQQVSWRTPLWLKGGSGRLKQKTLQGTCYME
jgi:hypothetical protein